ncbi:unnamed protein product [Owenia fusiformis]|uniref:Uncharacterized protein n=1 Tax=Owenia fusiformis TaxID=6347 RepID=A0A8J1XIF0_OWEFU|nr:unnamed protein product [Owenia fusiformis]
MKIYILAIIIGACLGEESNDDFLGTILPSPKLWWARRITKDFYTAGRLTARQIKYAHEVGFRSIVSTFNFTESETLGDEHLPSAKEYVDIAQECCGMPYKAIFLPGEGVPDASRIEVIQRFWNVMQEFPKPVLFHCKIAFTASFVLLAHLANMTRHDNAFNPQIKSADIYRIGAEIGNDYTAEHFRKTIAEITGEPEIENPQVPDAQPLLWRYHGWFIKPILNNWFFAGQSHYTHLELHKGGGFKSIVNLRSGISYLTDKDNNEINDATENVNLININDYEVINNVPNDRQSLERLANNRVFPEKPSSYLCDSCQDNFESSNALEYGDEYGYNEQKEREAVTKAGLDYYHLPVDNAARLKVDTFWKYKDSLMEAGNKGPVIIHSGSGHRAVVFGILAAGYQYGKDSAWALQRAHSIGHFYTAEINPDVIQIFKSVLDGRKQEL